MTPTQSFYPDTYRHQTIYRCCLCEHDTFDEGTAVYHSRFTHRFKGLPEENMPIGDWVNEKRVSNPVQGTKIGIGFLTWNTEDASALGASAILTELHVSRYLGIDCQLFWADNGSTDRTVPVLTRIFGDEKVKTLHFGENTGQSHARNAIIDEALFNNCGCLLMVDGDVGIIQYSLLAMASYLIQAPPNIGCIGMNSLNCTHEYDHHVSQFCRCIDPWMADEQPNIAWTNYGMFSRAVLEAVKFDENGPFSGPGWGYEDDDYVLSMNANGFRSFNTKFFRYMHRRRNSSIKNLGATSAAEVLRARQRYMVDKWSKSRDRATMAHIRRISAQGLPVLNY